MVCANGECKIEFVPKTHNQKYHNAECCRVATNRRIMEKYYAARDQKAGKARYCKKCRVTKLSRYNNSLICGGCKAAGTNAANSAVADMISSQSFIA